MEIVEIGGWFNVILLSINILLFIIRRINKNLAKNNIHLKKLGLILAKVHKYTGFLLILTGIIHGYIALNGLYLHTGLLLWFSIIITFIIYLLGKFKIIKKWLYIHRFMAIIIIIMLLIHLINPWLIV